MASITYAYMVSYDLMMPGQNYDDLINELKAFPNWCHCLDSTWVIKSSLPASQVRDKLKPHLDSNDKLIVAKLSGEAAWAGFSMEVADWLRANL